MSYLFKAGRITYGIGLIAYGVLQIYYKDFRRSIVPAWPGWMHTIIPVYIIGGLLILAGLLISGVLPVQKSTLRNVLLAAGGFFLLCFVCFHVPLNLFVSSNSPIHLGVWVDSLKALAFCGGALILVSVLPSDRTNNNSFLFLAGRIFFSTTIILFGVSHFYYIDFVSPMVPRWIGMPVFWTQFAGTALIASGTFIILNIASRPVALLQALMIFSWLIVLHIPRAIENPAANNGNEIASAFDALLFTGVALLVAYRRSKYFKSVV
ncbi:MAG: hypothetical protein H7Y86_00445 [Rhizobacter sp.]|nr:hypothetical protein [Ferruginibacter sp.]